MSVYKIIIGKDMAPENKNTSHIYAKWSQPLIFRTFWPTLFHCDKHSFDNNLFNLNIILYINLNRLFSRPARNTNIHSTESGQKNLPICFYKIG